MKTLLYLSLLFFVGCGGTPGVIQPTVEPNTIADAFKYDEDLKACNNEAYSLTTCGGKEGYLGNATASGLWIGCPGGLIVGAVQAAKNEPLRREHVEQCMTEKGYKVLDRVTSPPSKMSPAPPEAAPRPSKVSTAAPSTSPAPSKVTATKSAEQLGMEQRLQKLMELRQKNLITNEEYQKAKKEVLRKLTE